MEFAPWRLKKFRDALFDSRKTGQQCPIFRLASLSKAGGVLVDLLVAKRIIIFLPRLIFVLRTSYELARNLLGIQTHKQRK
jgi:hypothetical protein